jgi:hypothetical protein
LILRPSDRAARRASPWMRAGGIRPAFNPLPILTDPARRPSPRRLRRVTDQWLPVGHGSMIAKIVVLTHGGHQRPVIHRSSKHLRFRFVSTKTGTTQLGEGKGEAFLATLNEVDTRVVDYECHPFEIHISRGGEMVRYRPDAVRQLADGTIELIEAKRTAADLADPKYRATLAAIAEIARLCGWAFRIMYLDEIIGPPVRRLNVEALFGRRTMELSRHENRVAGRAVAVGVTLTWADMRDQLAPNDPLQGDAVIERLLAGGLLSTDLDQRFTPRTLLVPHRPFTGRSGIRL